VSIGRLRWGWRRLCDCVLRVCGGGGGRAALPASMCRCGGVPALFWCEVWGGVSLGTNKNKRTFQIYYYYYYRRRHVFITGDGRARDPRIFAA